MARPLPEPEPQPVLTPLTDGRDLPGGDDRSRRGGGRQGPARRLAGLQRSVGFRAPGAPLACVAGIGSGAWDRLFAGPRPAELHPFRELAGTVHHAPATPGDLLFHIRRERMDLCFESWPRSWSGWPAAVTVVDEVHGFRYFDERDLLGFVDGTENPAGAAAGTRRWSATRILSSPAAATSSCRSTCTTWRPGTR